ncbi:replication factor-a protein [Heliocybe sulcata]|uniref:Replication protein A subunit n=1 Tax=Heliocybe sulcata TaxID=5364 RepID=A0A5C3NDV3_9AGAM|nr:replication factor-a protein [Heliocybe sulcata]
MQVELSGGMIKRLFNSQDTGEDLSTSQPILQVISMKKVDPPPNATNHSSDRWRTIISDGEHFMQGMFATQVNGLIEAHEIQKNTVIAVENFSCSYLQGKRLLIIMAARVITQAGEKIGKPENVQGGAAAAAESSAPQTPNPAPSPSTTTTTPVPHAQSRQQSSAKVGGKANSIYPIEGLSPYQNNWTIKARVTQKTDVKTWSNQRGEGKLFSVTLMDETGEIRATGFNSVVDELYDKLQEGNVYYISKARVNLAKKKFSNIQNDYELALERNTEVEECPDASNVPAVRYNFVNLNGLEELQKDATCDFIGVIKDVGDLGTITSKASNKTVAKRDLTLVDQTGKSVRLTLWGAQAEQFNADDSPVVAFKGVKVGDFGGRSLSMYSSSTMSINPDITEAHSLRGWYDALGSGQNFTSMSSGSNAGSSTMGGVSRDEMRTLFDVKESGLGTSDKADYFSCRATIMHIKGDNISYPACPTEGCNKKVVDIGGQWRCEKCDRSFERPEHRYIMSMAVADHTAQAWLQGFNDVGLAVFGMSANELVDIKERDEPAYNVILHKSNCATFNFACRAKQDTYNDQTRIRYGISRLTPLDYKAEMRALKTILQSPWARA